MRAQADGRRLLPDGRDHAALGRDRQHPARPRSRWSASTSTPRRSPSSPTAAPRRPAASSPTSGCSSSSSQCELVPDVPRGPEPGSSARPGRRRADGAGLRAERRPAARGGTTRCPTPTSDRASAVAGGLQQQVAGVADPAADRRPPRGRTPPPGWPAPTPSHSPTSANAASATGSPCSAAAVTIGPVSRSGRRRRPLEQRRARPEPRAGIADQRVAAAVLLPAADAAALARRPSGTTCMWPNSPAMPLRPRCTRAVEHHRAADAGAERDDARASRRRRPAPYVASARAAQLASLSSRTGVPARGSRRPHVLAAPGQVRGEHAPARPAASTNPAAAMPTPSTRRPSATSLDRLGQRVLDDRSASTRAGRGSRGAPCDHAGRPSTPRPRGPWCRRRRRR